MKTAFLITARLKSTRLPKKIMLRVMGKPLIVHMIERIKHANHIDRIIICTSTNSQDDPLEKIARAEGILCHRGSEEDVLQRLLNAANEQELKFFANMTADIPMIDPNLIDKSIKEYLSVKADLVIPPPDHVGACNVVNVNALESVCKQKKVFETEIWVQYFQELHACVHTMKLDEKFRHKSLKTCLDYPEDYDFIKHVFSELYYSKKVFSSLDIIDLVARRPDLLAINSSSKHFKRWEDHSRSLLKH